MTVIPTDSPDNAVTEVASAAPDKRDSFISRLSTGTGAFNVLGPRKIYYAVAIVLVVASLLLIFLRGFNLGIDFAGGTQITIAPNAGQVLDQTNITDVVNQATGLTDVTPQKVGSNVEITTSLDSTNNQDKGKVDAAVKALVTAFHLPASSVTSSAVSQTWGSEVSKQAVISVIVFLIAVALFIWIRYERRAAVAAVASTIQVMVITAGIYSLVGFELSPSTVIGLLTILGFSLYDTVVVYDKVQENTRGLLSLTRRTYSEAANLGINQTLMRSINTSLIALLPVAGLLIAGIALLGSGTLKDLALVQLIGMIVGAYSSLFVAVPMSVDLRLLEPNIKAHTKRVIAKRESEGLLVDSVGDPIGRTAPVVRTNKSSRARSAAKSTTAKLPSPKPATAAQSAPMVDEAPAMVTVSKPAAAAPTPLVPDMQPGEKPRPGVRPPTAKSKPRPTGKNARPTGKRQR
ncbi:MAG: protein translocase subunit SecF [Nakamurella sp.]